ncbi:hypothetical protein P7C71_g1484, partial [Lecanoromycetidae sp. Uapishka_2]
MPGIYKKLVVIAAVEGLILRPPGQRNQRNLQIKYKTHEISNFGSSIIPSSSASVEIHGIVDVALIPLCSQTEAKRALDQAKESLIKGGKSTTPEDSDTSDDEEAHVENEPTGKDKEISSIATDSPASEEDLKARPVNPERSTSNVAEDVIGRKGQYGRFAERWFSRKGWSTDKRRTQGMSTDDVGKLQSASSQGSVPEDETSVQKEELNTLKAEKAPDPISMTDETQRIEETAVPDNSSAGVASSLLPKLLRTTRTLLGSRSFFYSYDLDITRRIGNQGTKAFDLALHKSVDPLSACAQKALEKQLKEEGVEADLLTDTSTQWFNTLWADNGDAISRQYANTAALKGDYTRTRRRNYRGAINDLGLTLSRYYNNIVNDYFSQAAIDYILGNVTSQIFDEFEANLENRDPAMSMAKVRANAVDTCSKIVIADPSEDLVGGWTLMSPHEPNSVRTYPFEEVCLLITDAALYRVKFDWNAEKVSAFERVDLGSITGIIRGTYITSTLTASQIDPEKNFGFVIKYKPGKNIARVNTRSLSSAVGLDGSESCDLEGNSEQSSRKSEGSELKVLAFKALPARDSFTSMEGQETQAMSEKELVSNVCEEVRRAVLGQGGGVTECLEDQDIVSLAEAKKSAGLIEQWGHSIKKMVWA